MGLFPLAPIMLRPAHPPMNPPMQPIPVYQAQTARIVPMQLVCKVQWGRMGVAVPDLTSCGIEPHRSLRITFWAFESPTAVIRPPPQPLARRTGRCMTQTGQAGRHRIGLVGWELSRVLLFTRNSNERHELQQAWSASEPDWIRCASILYEAHVS